MKVQIVIQNGELRLATQEGLFEEGKARLEELLAVIGTEAKLQSVGEVETHRHEQGEAHVHGHVHN